MGHVAVEQLQLVDGRDARVDLAGDALDAQTVTAPQGKLELLCRGVGQETEEGTAVDRQRHRRAVDPDRRDRPPAHHLHRQLDRLDLAGRVRQHRQHQAQDGERAGASAAPRRCAQVRLGPHPPSEAERRHGMDTPMPRCDPDEPA